MKKLVVVIAVVAMTMLVMVTGCNRYDKKEMYVECKFGAESGRDFGCMTWDVHYYGYNSRDMAEVDREVMTRNGIVCTAIKSEHSKGRVVYSFKTLNSRV